MWRLRRAVLEAIVAQSRRANNLAMTQSYPVVLRSARVLSFRGAGTSANLDRVSREEAE